MVLTLYHVTPDLRHMGYFVPRVPENAEHYDEDAVTPRICLSSSIEGCLTSAPFGGSNLDSVLEDTGGLLRVFKLEIPNPEVLIRDGILVTPEMLAGSGRVMDALVGQEYWLMCNYTFKPHDTFIIRVTSYMSGTYRNGGVLYNVSYKSGDIEILTSVLYQTVHKGY